MSSKQSQCFMNLQQTKQKQEEQKTRTKTPKIPFEQRINKGISEFKPKHLNKDKTYTKVHQQKMEYKEQSQFRIRAFSQQKQIINQKCIKPDYKPNPSTNLQIDPQKDPQTNPSTNPQTNKQINPQTSPQTNPQAEDQIDAEIQHDYDIKDISNNNDEYQKLLIYTNILFYYNKNQQNLEKQSQSQQGQHKIRGKLYNTLYDHDQNPSYIIQEGEFLVDLNKKQFKLDGQGIEYQGKSNQVKIQGEFKQGVQAQRIPSSQNKSQYKSFSVEPKRIKIMEIIDGQPIQINNRIEKKSTWCKYNQQFYQRDLDIFKSNQWLNSSIIDCYVLSLNKKSEEEYFNLSQDKRRQIKRIYFVTSSLTTNISRLNNIQQGNDLFQKHFLELQEVKYKIQTIYSKIGFPVVSNSHWFFLLFDLEENKVEIFNSLKPNLNAYQNLITKLSELLMVQNPQQSINGNSGSQNDGYSCGYHVCCFMKICHKAQFSNSSLYHYDEKEMRGILRDLINY
ncbi:unnamed protein product (macronuclear) [Paramecium tetraurelia]|uniref:Ubiquitin-like protease family profile domain-containing protein n=1 Tax=Paramecium tetraurelia TaxID=5888 RepID=A0DML0_PARTE|nr:uncharacterized protein GSPATT00018495001 [Paramecium tetraurelia]CAK84277.1 unnamed protein product [Paramecium tetraurelia]|eukprot:XP_001451674.1 hypothetical protein (macronuclear) [Paramecium tetraurelia strain d4-2]